MLNLQEFLKKYSDIPNKFIDDFFRSFYFIIFEQVIFFFLAFVNIFRRKQLREIVNQVFYIGATSSLIVMLVGLFTGMVLGLQLFYTLVKFGSVGALGSAISLSLVREMGPVLTAIMITARAGSGIAAEIGILRISEQVDALYTMGVDPVRYLISPRIAASIISFPLLTAFFDLIGIIHKRLNYRGRNCIRGSICADGAAANRQASDEAGRETQGAASQEE